MKRLTVAAAAAVLMLAVAPRLHAQAAQQGQKKPDSNYLQRKIAGDALEHKRRSCSAT